MLNSDYYLDSSFLLGGQSLDLKRCEIFWSHISNGFKMTPERISHLMFGIVKGGQKEGPPGKYSLYTLNDFAGILT